MFRNTYQKGFLSLFYSLGSNPLLVWSSKVKNGHIKRVTDNDVKSLALELMGANVATTYITAPTPPFESLGIKLPFLVLVLKNMKKFFSFEIQILDDKNMLRRFRVSNYQSTTRVKPFCTSMPLGLQNGWNQIQFNLADFTRRCYGTNYVESVRIQVHANVRIRQIYFSDRLYTEDEKPPQFKLYTPAPVKRGRPERKVGKDAAKSKPEQEAQARPSTPDGGEAGGPPEGEEGEAGEIGEAGEGDAGEDVVAAEEAGEAPPVAEEAGEPAAAEEAPAEEPPAEEEQAAAYY